jgi:hypothetical protein
MHAKFYEPALAKSKKKAGFYGNFYCLAVYCGQVIKITAVI